MTDVFRFLAGASFLTLAGLSLVPAMTRVLWGASVAAEEWGYWIAFAALLPLIPTRTQAPIGKLGSVLSVGAIVLFLLPVVKAKQLSDDLPAAFDAQFGASRRERTQFAGDRRPDPLVLFELLKPLSLPAVRFEQRTFAMRDGRALTLDVYRPSYVHGPLPAVVVVYGGVWQHGGNNEFVALNAYLAGRDYVVIAIDYRHAPAWRFPAGRDDVLSAVAYVKVYAAEMGVDPARLVLLGRSDGGQLALLAGYTAQDPAIRGVISLYGSTDVEFAYEHPATKTLFDTRGTLDQYLGGSPASAKDPYFDASPINFVTSASPPTLLVHGMRDPVISPLESARLDARLEEAHVRHLFVQLSWATHGCDKSFGGPCGQVTNYAVERFLDSVTIGAARRGWSRL
jgi:acetyl esterase/lipase